MGEISHHLEVIVMFGRGFYIKLVKFLIFATIYLAFCYLYFFLAQLSHSEKTHQNKIGRVQEVVDKSDDTIDNSDFALDEDPVQDEFKGAEEEDQGDSKQLIKAVEEIEENNKQEVANLEEDSQDDTWHEDKEEKIMDAKVMRKVDQKLIIVDVPNPKQRW